MGILRAFTDSVGGTFADQWKEIITAGTFDEHLVVAPGIMQNTNRWRGNNLKSSHQIISNGSKIFVPENTAAFIFSGTGIENVITEPGRYEYQDSEKSIFDGDGVRGSFVDQIKDRIGYSGIPSNAKQIAYVNLREIRSIGFGTKGPQMYNDLFYGCDLEILAYGSFTVQVVSPEVFIRKFVPANVSYYSFDDEQVRNQIVSEFMQSFMSAVNVLSNEYRISELPARSNDISIKIQEDAVNAGTWVERFGFKMIKSAIENIEFSEVSRELVKQFSTNKMNLKAYEDVSQRASNISAQQRIAKGIEDNGLGDGGGMIFGMNMAQGLGMQAEGVLKTPHLSMDEQVEMVKKLKELLDTGILTSDEFQQKKKEIMGL